MDNQLEDHLEKCRCCFRVIISDQKKVELNQNIEQRFFELTQISLIIDPCYSNIICDLCDKDLKSFSYLKKDISTKQKRLYELLPLQKSSETIESHLETVENEKSSEHLEFVDIKTCPPETKPSIREEKHEQVQVKSENQLKISVVESKISTTVQNIECPDCGNFLANKSSYERHVDRVHLKIKNFYCDLCPYKSFFKHSLAKHLLKHIPEAFREKFQCDLCQFTSISSVNIVLHKKYEHERAEKFRCHIKTCGKVFSRPSQLGAHVRLTHEKIKNKVCEFCLKKFSTATRLKEHITSAHHSPSQRDFICELCSKSFVTLRNLKNHQVYHDEPKFVCEIGCGKKFYQAILLESHHRTHSDKKDFECSYVGCGKKYFLKSHLKRHVESVHEKIKVTCALCTSSFVRREYYKKHLIICHPEVSEAEIKKFLERMILIQDV